MDVRANTPHCEGRRESLGDFERLEVLKVNGHALDALGRAWRGKHQQVEHLRGEGDALLWTLLPSSTREVVFCGFDGVEIQAAMLELTRTDAVGGCCLDLKSVVLASSGNGVVVGGRMLTSGRQSKSSWRICLIKGVRGLSDDDTNSLNDPGDGLDRGAFVYQEPW